MQIVVPELVSASCWLPRISPQSLHILLYCVYTSSTSPQNHSHRLSLTGLNVAQHWIHPVTLGM